MVESWLRGTRLEYKNKYHVVARSAFGGLYLWGENSGASLKISAAFSRYYESTSMFIPDRSDKAVKLFFVARTVEGNDLADMFLATKERLGVLRHDEMYGFVLALMLGGSGNLDTLQRVKTIEHLMLLSQIAELRPYGFPDLG